MSEKQVGLTDIGRVKQVEIGLEDHGIFGWNIEIDFGSSGQGTGWRFLEGQPNAGEILKDLLTFFKVDRFEKIKGRVIEVEREIPFGMIVALKIPKFDGGGVLLLEDVGKSEPQLSDDHK